MATALKNGNECCCESQKKEDQTLLPILNYIPSINMLGTDVPMPTKGQPDIQLFLDRPECPWDIPESGWGLASDDGNIFNGASDQNKTSPTCPQDP